MPSTMETELNRIPLSILMFDLRIFGNKTGMKSSGLPAASQIRLSRMIPRTRPWTGRCRGPCWPAAFAASAPRCPPAACGFAR